MLQRLTIFSFALLWSFCSAAQNTTSPYSILGIGDIETKDYGKFFGMASTSLAVRSASFINLNNPASLTALDPNMINIDMNARWRSSSFQYPVNDTFTSSYSDAAIRRMSLTFRPGKIWGLSMGIKPYSTVNYQLDEKLSLPGGGVTSINKTVTGSGGINQVYVANGFQIGKHLSVGLTASYLFGSLTRNTLYHYENLGINIQRDEYEQLRGFQFQGGLQYMFNTGAGIAHTIGITVANPTTLKGVWETEYKENDTLLNSNTDDGHSFKLPLQIGAGYACVIDNMITIAADYNFYNWEKTKLNYPNAYLHAAQRFSLGFQYAPLKKTQGQMREKLFIQAGLAYEQGYISIKNKQIDDMSVTVGIGSNLTRLINAYVGLEIGRKGNVNYEQIRENYTQLSFGVTIKEFWYNTKRMRLYQ